MNTSIKRFFLAVFAGGFFLALNTGLIAQNTRGTSQFDPATVTLGQNANYVVTVEIKSGAKFTPPAPAGLELTYLGPSQSMQSTYSNGKFDTLVQTSFRFRATAQATGSYKVPAFTLKLEGKNFDVPEATFTVLPPDGKSQVSLDEVSFLKLVCPDTPIYVGQVARCALNLYVLTAFKDARFNPPIQSGDAFSQGGIDENGIKSGERIADLNYNKIAWPVTFTPLKSGLQKIEYQMLVEFTVPSANRQRRTSRNDIFGGFFNLREQRQQLNLTTKEITLNILALPEEGKPENFSGAIGHFKVTQNLSAEEMNAGDPLTLTLVVSGEGNFERIQPPEIEIGQDWKTYTPKVEFTPRDTLNFKGSKTFEYVLIPQNEEVNHTPKIEFNYFDSDAARYVEATLPSATVTVNPAPLGTATFTAISPLQNGSGQTPREKTLLAIQLFPGKWVATLRPIFTSPRFFAVQAAPLFLLGGIVFLRKRQLRLREDFYYARNLKAGKSMRKWLQNSKKAATANEPEAFFAASQRAIQESFSRHFKQRADTLTQSEILSFLESKDAGAELMNEVSNFFQTADAIKFAGSVAESPSLKEREKTLSQLVAQLTNLK